MYFGIKKGIIIFDGRMMNFNFNNSDKFKFKRYSSPLKSGAK